MKTKVLFRADANPNIGMGHLMRCLSIAGSFRAAGGQASFILADDGAEPLVRQRGYEAIILHSDYRAMEDELDLWPKEIPDILIVDSYSVTAHYLRSLKQKVGEDCETVYLDDLAALPYPVDVLVNYNAYGPELNYPALYRGHPPTLLLGPTYAPLRTMFRGVEKKAQPEKVRSILVSTGGADPLHVALHLLEAVCRRNGGETFHFLIGAMNADRDQIRALATGRPDVVLHENVSDMRRLIERADLAISAAGSTLYEICACGVPLVTYCIADNQIPGAKAFEKLGIAVNAGDLRDETPASKKTAVCGSLKKSAIETVMESADRLASDHLKRCAMGTRMQEMIDGLGADRMVAKLTVSKGKEA